jgi:hypothetical protein
LKSRAFTIDAFVVLPDHLPAVCKLRRLVRNSDLDAAGATK